ncbi:MAG TPA: DUF6506 family protein [Solirubrobacteraceae bacterium]|jgi:hypothetical protein|nr:DUF6506 family protein [Solirubrobacteraceae bacterium]
MTFNWGFIYLGLGTEDPAVDRAVIERGDLTTTIVAVPDRDTAAQVAVELADGGAQTIELCGAFGTRATAQVIEAVGDRVPVGSVSYGIEFASAVAALSASTPA